MVLGKHDYIVRRAADRIARELGRTLVSFVPQGSYDPPSDNMLFLDTLGIPESVFGKYPFQEAAKPQPPSAWLRHALVLCVY